MPGKVFQHGDAAVGWAGGIRGENILRTRLKPISLHGDESPIDAVIREIADPLREAIGKDDLEGCAVIALGGKWLILQGDFSVYESTEDVVAIGAASDIAVGAAYALVKLNGRARCFRALEVAAQLHTTVAGPFTCIEIPLTQAPPRVKSRRGVRPRGRIKA